MRCRQVNTGLSCSLSKTLRTASTNAGLWEPSSFGLMAWLRGASKGTASQEKGPRLESTRQNHQLIPHLHARPTQVPQEDVLVLCGRHSRLVAGQIGIGIRVTLL